MTMFIAMTIWFLGFAVGFVAYYAARVGVKEWRKLEK